LSREQRAALKQRGYPDRPDQVMVPDVRIGQGQFWTVSDLPIVGKAWPDHAPWHYGQLIDLIDSNRPRARLYFPPTCPDLNSQEHVWADARERVSHNHTHRQFQPLIDDFETYLNGTVFSTDFMDAFTPFGLGVF
jgi:hypothetical protein